MSIYGLFSGSEAAANRNFSLVFPTSCVDRKNPAAGQLHPPLIFLGNTLTKQRPEKNSEFQKQKKMTGALITQPVYFLFQLLLFTACIELTRK